MDPLSRRSLLLHTPDDAAPYFVLTSARSSVAREMGVAMRALDGGATGILDLRAGELGSVRMWTRSPLRPVNALLPEGAEGDKEMDAAEAECPRFLEMLEDAVRRRVANIPAAEKGYVHTQN